MARAHGDTGGVDEDLVCVEVVLQQAHGDTRPSLSWFNCGLM